VAIKEVVDSDDLMLITVKAVILRIHVGNISVTGRDTMGVRLMKLDEGDRISDVARVIKEDASDLNNE